MNSVASEKRIVDGFPVLRFAGIVLIGSALAIVLHAGVGNFVVTDNELVFGWLPETFQADVVLRVLLDMTLVSPACLIYASLVERRHSMRD